MGKWLESIPVATLSSRLAAAASAGGVTCPLCCVLLCSCTTAVLRLVVVVHSAGSLNIGVEPGMCRGTPQCGAGRWHGSGSSVCVCVF